MIVRDDGVSPLPADLRDAPLVVFDSDCVFCSRSMRILVKLDRLGVFRLTSAQGPIGQALYAHLGLAIDDFETNIVRDRGAYHLKSDSVIAIARRLPWPARAALVLGLVPERMRDAAYGAIASRRYRLFGRRAACGLADPDIAKRLV